MNNRIVLVSCFVFFLSSTAFGQGLGYGNHSLGALLGASSSYGALSDAGDQADSYNAKPQTHPDLSGTAFEKIGKLYDAGQKLDKSILLANPLLKNAVVVRRNAPNLVHKDVVLVSIDTGNDVLGPILYAQTYGKVVDENGDEDDQIYFDRLRKNIDEGKMSNPLEYAEEDNALVEYNGALNSLNTCRAKVSLRLTQIEDGRQLVVIRAAQADHRRECNPNSDGVIEGQAYLHSYVVLPN